MWILFRAHAVGCLVAVVFLFAVRPGSAQQTDPVTFDAGSWIGYANFLPDGSFSFCMVGKAFDQETLFLLSYPDDGMALTLFNEGWDLPENEFYELEVSVDRRHRERLGGRGAGSYLVLELSDRPALQEALRTGDDLHIEGAQAKFSYPLSGLDYALDRALDCVDEHSEADAAQSPSGDGESANPFKPESTGEEREAEQGSEDTQTESSGADYAIAYFHEHVLPLLIAAGVEDPYFLNEQELEDEYQGTAVLAWQSPGEHLQGYLSGTESSGSVLDTLRDVTQRDSVGCEETPESSWSTKSRYGTEGVARLSVICEIDGYLTTYIELVGFATNEDFVVVFTTASTKEYNRTSRRFSDSLAELLSDGLRP